MFFFLFFFRRLADNEQPPVSAESNLPISVIICTHNEQNNLKRNLPSFLEQKYSQYEVIVVNDNSDDETELLLMQMETRYPQLVVRHIKNQSQNLRGKKYPLTIGIRAAKYDHVLLTDVDCAASSDYWIRDMAGMFTPEKEIILGYSPFKSELGFLNKFIRYEAFITAMQYFSFALAKIPYMGVGRNLAYRKQIFFDHNIYPKYPQLISGDDDLLINHAANKRNTTIQIRPSSFVYSEPKHTWDEYWHQKQRHVSTARYYKWNHRLLLSVYSASNLLLYPFFLACIFYSPFAVEGLVLFLTRLLVQSVVYNSAMKKLAVADLFILFPLMDLVFLFYYLKLLPHLKNTKLDRWK